ncbi:MAG: biotin--[acetyl-CoA-carboxylase] ligase [Candidatus Rokubacteria bacterium]|nr:biotin--[acetyl-CoA-carboxylase] ligase [Candidatus Rokubacteria bacterium]
MTTSNGTVHDALSTEIMRRELQSETFPSRILIFTSVLPSTSGVLRALAAQGAGEGTVVIAEQLAAGAGRPREAWFSPPGVNLCLSVLLRSGLPSGSLDLLPMVAALALAETVEDEGLRAGLKWPNDVLVGGRQVGATFVESVPGADGCEWAIVTVGVNLNISAEALQAGLGGAAERATSLCEAAGREVDRNRFAARLLNRLDAWLEAWRQRGPEPILVAWRRRDVLAGRAVIIRNRGAAHHRRVVGVNHRGHLVVEDPAGGAYEIVGGDVQLVA